MPPVLENLSITYGQVAYRHEVPAVSATSERTGNVTVNREAQAGSPAHFEVSFMLNSKFTGDGLTVTNIFHFNVLVTGLGPEASYSDIEKAATAQVAPMLHLLVLDLEAKGTVAK